MLDSLDWVEPLIWKTVCQEAKVEHIEQAFGWYGKGFVRALDIWRTLIKEFSVLNEKMHVRAFYGLNSKKNSTANAQPSQQEPAVIAPLSSNIVGQPPAIQQEPSPALIQSGNGTSPLDKVREQLKEAGSLN